MQPKDTFFNLPVGLFETSFSNRNVGEPKDTFFNLPVGLRTTPGDNRTTKFFR